VGPGHRDALLQAHELCEHQRARHDRNALRLAATTSKLSGFTAEDTTTASAEAMFVGPVAQYDFCPQVCQPLGRCVGCEVRTAHFVAQVEQDLRDAAHARASDPDEVNPFDFVFHFASSMQICAT